VVIVKSGKLLLNGPLGVFCTNYGLGGLEKPEMQQMRKHKVKRSMKEPVIGNRLADIPHNKYSWRKYGHELIKGSSHPRKFRHQMIITRSVIRCEVTIQLEVVPYDVCGGLREHRPIGSSLRAVAENKTVGLIGVSHKITSQSCKAESTTESVKELASTPTGVAPKFTESEQLDQKKDLQGLFSIVEIKSKSKKTDEVSAHTF
nr:probable WRKY transcription factor 21 [Tanacetum cinerariifolium]